MAFSDFKSFDKSHHYPENCINLFNDLTVQRNILNNVLELTNKSGNEKEIKILNCYNYHFGVGIANH